MIPDLVVRRATEGCVIGEREGRRTWTVLGNHTVNGGGFDTVHDVVACAGHEMTIAAYFYLFL